MGSTWLEGLMKNGVPWCDAPVSVLCAQNIFLIEFFWCTLFLLQISQSGNSTLPLMAEGRGSASRLEVGDMLLPMRPSIVIISLTSPSSSPYLAFHRWTPMNQFVDMQNPIIKKQLPTQPGCIWTRYAFQNLKNMKIFRKNLKIIGHKHTQVTNTREKKFWPKSEICLFCTQSRKIIIFCRNFSRVFVTCVCLCPIFSDFWKYLHIF